MQQAEPPTPTPRPYSLITVLFISSLNVSRAGTLNLRKNRIVLI
jgi:hypothetical protein